MRNGIIGIDVTVKVDRPLGSRHPSYPDTVYTVNYGYIEGICGGDGEWQDAYILGVDMPVDSFCGVVAARIVRKNDTEEKWVVVPRGFTTTREMILSKTFFCERYFDIEIIM